MLHFKNAVVKNMLQRENASILEDHVGKNELVKLIALRNTYCKNRNQRKFHALKTLFIAEISYMKLKLEFLINDT